MADIRYRYWMCRTEKQEASVTRWRHTCRVAGNIALERPIVAYSRCLAALGLAEKRGETGAARGPLRGWGCRPESKGVEVAGGTRWEREGARDGSSDPGKGTDKPPDDELLSPTYGVPQLMSRLGRLLEQYEPGEVLIMSREAYEHRQSTAYASGWKDAADEYRPHISSAWWEGWLGRRRPLRAVGPGEVIPFPAGRRAAEPNGVAGNDAACGAVPQDGVGEARDARGTGLYGHAEDAAGGGGGEAGETSERNRHRRPPDSPSDDPSDVETRAPQSGARSRPSSVKPSLSPKSRRSKSPTIPPLTRPPRRRRPTGDTPEEATD